MIAECHGGFSGESFTAVRPVPLGKVGKHQQPRPALGGDPAGLARREVPVLAGQLRVSIGEGGLAYQQIRPISERERGIAQPGVHDEGKPLSRLGLTDLLQRHDAAIGHQLPVALEPPHIGAGDAEGVKLVGEHPPAIRFPHAVTDRRHGVGQAPGVQPKWRRLRDRPAGDRSFPQV